MIVMPFSALQVHGVQHPLAHVLVLADVPLCHSMASTSVVLPWSRAR